MRKLEGRIAIVTGATSGMGQAIAERFAAEGAAVVIGGRNVARGEAVVDAITRAGGLATMVPGDIATVEANQALVDAAVQQYGGVDILVPNAGMLGNGSVLEAPIARWNQTIQVNLNAVYYLIKLAAPQMLQRERASIVVIGSIAAFKAFPNHPAYCASKGALLALVRQLAIDLAPTIRVNILCPGQVDTPLLHQSAKAFPNPDTIVQEVADTLPLQRLGIPDDIAAAALFLASEDAGWITGTALTIDGGGMAG